MKKQKSPIKIEHVALLANLKLKSQEKEVLKSQLTNILKYIEHIEIVDTKNVKPTFNVSGNKNIKREDKVGKCLSQEEAILNAKNKKDGFFVTQALFDKESSAKKT